MSWNTVTLAEQPFEPWRNGGGRTRTLLAQPAETAKGFSGPESFGVQGGHRQKTLGLSGADWDWRLSVAEVEQGGAFSAFPGVQRWFSVLGGAGVRLEVDDAAGTGTGGGHAVHTLRPGDEALCFDGAAATHCHLLDGPTQDLNLMLRQGRATGALRRVQGVHQATLDATVLIAVYAMNTRARLVFGTEESWVEPATLAWRRVERPSVLRCSAPLAWWVEVRTP
ncbi:MAG: HutD/Ves family protein [Rhodoferax sp.]